MLNSLASGPSAQPKDTKAVVDLKSLLEDLPPELYKEIKSFVFTTSTSSPETTSTPCTHEPLHPSKEIQITRIDESYLPPHWMQVNRASRAAFSAQLFTPTTTFLFPSIAIMEKWIQSLPSSDKVHLLRMKIYCINTLKSTCSLTVSISATYHATLPAEANHSGDTVESLDRQVRSIERVVRTNGFGEWLARVLGTIPRNGFDHIRFVGSEEEMFKAMRCDATV